MFLYKKKRTIAPDTQKHHDTPNSTT
jgi:hypothetical protein